MPPPRPAAPLAALIAALIAAALSTLPAAGQEVAEGRIGLGAGVAPEYPGADEYTPIPIVPLSVRYEGFGFRTAGQGIQADVSGIRFIDFGPIVQFRGGRDDHVDDRIVARLPEVDPALEVGGFVEINLPFFLPGADAFTFIGRASFDVIGGHDGFVIEPKLRYSVPIGEDFRFNVIGGTTFGSRDFNEAYFGVSGEGSVLSGLPVYDAGSGFNEASLAITGTWFFSEDFGITLVGRYQRLIGDAGDSPIVTLRGSRDQWVGGIALSYRF